MSPRFPVVDVAPMSSLTNQTNPHSSPRHAAAELDGITGAQVNWADSKGLNERGTKGAQAIPRN